MEKMLSKTRFKQIIKKNDWSAYFFILPAMIIVFMFILYPAVWSLISSFKEVKPLMLRNSGLFQVPGKWIGLKNYILTFKDKLFLKSVLNTLYFSVIFIPLTMLCSVTLAVLLDRKLKGIGFMRTVFFLPYVVSIISASLIFMMLFNGDKGMINGVLNLLNIDGPNWLSDSKLAMPVIAIMSSWRRIGYFMLIYLAGLQNIPGSLYEAADIDGASWFQQFRMITWPLLRRITMVVFILLLINCFNVFQEIFVMTGGGPGDSTTTIPFLIYNEAFKFYHIGKASAMSYILFVVVVIISLTQNKLNSKKLDY
ncbi:carbohydrate ABC transporter permease [Caldisalinibacter kiritimatiensis]|uniref:N-Acetyl-D-glucosamine ABC transport system, permease protein 1 n=1 Tax=Caldisalinibacter kiritimatiensis TaxID=1304284 RepID=R1CZ03_9FIRM|nr:sugar ABC transporter permease [Caldisalinibacter kiritimatiensis]EOD01809.1 N-Acetyl-D-glucosamine ABC transport system, permease protein 1 [Caldisalinibacter kiritimatiensis]